jgi:hypothetical protein
MDSRMRLDQSENLHRAGSWMETMHLRQANQGFAPDISKRRKNKMACGKCGKKTKKAAKKKVAKKKKK